MTQRTPTTPRSLPSTPRIRHAPVINTMNNTMNNMNAITAAQFNNVAASSTQESVIVELTRRLAEQEAQIRRLAQQQPNGAGFNPDVYHTLLTHYMEREEELRLANASNQEQHKKLNEIEKLVQNLQDTSTRDRRAMKEKDEKLARLANKQQHESKHIDAIVAAKDIIKKKETEIDYLNKEKVDLIVKKKEAAKREKHLREEIAGHEARVSKSKKRAEEQATAMLENEEKIKGHDGVVEKKDKETESLKEVLKKNTHTIDSKDALLNMQRQEMGKQEDLLQMYETKFLAKDMDVPKVVARADEGERLWSKIEEREKKFAGKEIMIRVLREENMNLQADKKRLQGEYDELKSSFELCDLRMSGTGDKVQMNWLMAQLRDTVQMKEKIIELEEIIKGEGYTVKAKEAEYDFRKMEIAMTLEMEKLTQAIEMLRSQTAKGQDLEVPILLGKLEECILIFEEDAADIRPVNDIISHILTAASSDLNQSMSLNSNNDSMDDGIDIARDGSVDNEWAENPLITTRDFKDLMHPDHFVIITSLVEGFSSLHREGLCMSAANHDYSEAYDEDEDEEDEDAALFEDRDDVVAPRGANDSVGVDKKDPPSSVKAEGAERGGRGAGKGGMPDLHLEKVFKAIQRDEADENDWRTWIPPGSPCSHNTAMFE